jgi:hypothetical protein
MDAINWHDVAEKIRIPSGMIGGLAETCCMVWRIFATKLETAETMEDVVLNMCALYFYPDTPVTGVKWITRFS